MDCVVCVYVQVELKSVDPRSGGYYYPDHLPLLGTCMYSFTFTNNVNVVHSLSDVFLFHRLLLAECMAVSVSTAAKQSPKFAKTVAIGCATVCRHNYSTL